MKMKKEDLKKCMSWFVLALVLIVIYKLLDNFGAITEWVGNLLSILMPFIMALIVAYLFYLPCSKLENLLKKRKSRIIKSKARWLSILIVYAIAILVIILIIQFVVPTVIESLGELISALPGYLNIAKDALNELPEDGILSKENLQSIIDELSQINLRDYINIETITEYAKGIIGLATGIFDVFITVAVSIYILAERTAILNFVKRLCGAIFNTNMYKALGKYFRESNKIFFKFISGQILDGVVVGILTAVAMSILGVKYGVLLGFMIGLFNLIPYLGAIVAVVITVLITLLTGGFSQAIWTLIVVIILQQIDANIINPRIIGSSLKISPILIIFSVTLVGSYFGVIGMFLVVPIVAIIKLMIMDYIKYKEEIHKREENECINMN